MASSDVDAPTPKCAQGSVKVQRGRKIPFLTFTEERSFPEDYDYTRVLDYFSDEDRDESSHDDDEEEEEVGDVSDADASDDRGSDDDYVGGGDGDDDGDSSDDDDDADGVVFRGRENCELEKERRGKQGRRAARGRLTRGRGSCGRGHARGQGRVGGGGEKKA